MGSCLSIPQKEKTSNSSHHLKVNNDEPDTTPLKESKYKSDKKTQSYFSPARPQETPQADSNPDWSHHLDIFLKFTDRKSSLKERQALMSQFLFENKALINTHDASGFSLLHIATFFRMEKELLLQVLESGANAGAQDNMGLTPLHIATLNEDEDSMIALLNYMKPSEIRLRTKDKESALIYAYSTENRSIIEFIQEMGILDEIKEEEVIPCSDELKTLRYFKVRRLHDYANIEMELRFGKLNYQGLKSVKKNHSWKSC